MFKGKQKHIIFLFLALLVGYSVRAQCPQLIDGQGVPSSNPYWIAPCDGNAYTLFIQSNDNIGSYTIDWGDGSPVESGSSLIPPAFVSHTYAATVDTFVVTFTETSSGCVIQGVVVMEVPVTAELGIPGGVSTQICAPDVISFVNNTNQTNGLPVSQTTVFTWNFGDGSPIEIYDYTNVTQIVSHLYQKNTVNCNTVVTLTAENYCGQSIATFSPIQVWDFDEAAITASQTLLCYPDTEVFLENTPQKNCLPDNNAQRYEYWNFGDYWGLGTDSIIDWQPYDPPSRPGYNIAYPGIGTYTVMVLDSNYCGVDTAYETITIVAPPTAGVSPVTTSVCEGQTATFVNLSGNGANAFSWNFGDGSGWISTGPGNQSHTYTTAGTYTVTLTATISGGSAACVDTATTNIIVMPSPTAAFTINNNNGCDTLTTSFTDNSINAIAWNWNFGNGNTSSSATPPPQFYASPGNYSVTLQVVGSNGCSNTTSGVVNVYQSPNVSFTSANVCVNSPAVFTDYSTSAPGDPIISWFWDFDDGGTSTSSNPSHIYTSAQTYNVSLFVSTAFCSASDTIPLTVEPKPVADFVLNSSAGCTPFSVSATNNSSGAANYVWDFGDGYTTSQVNPAYTYINNTSTDLMYNISLTAFTAFGCSDTAVHTVTVYAGAVSNFTHNGTVDCAPLMVTYTNTSSVATNYIWDFGDGNTTNQVNPVHTFYNNTQFITNYTTQLIAITANGCTDTSSQIITVYPELNVTFTAIPNAGCSPLQVTFPPAVGAVAWQWDFDDGTTSIQQTPTHIFVNNTTNNQTYNVELIATSPFGCKDTSYQTVTVYPKPNASINIDVNMGCHPLAVNFNNLSTGGSSYLWDFGDGNTSTSAAGLITHVFNNTSANAAVYNAQLIVSTTDGCTDTTSRNITVYPEVASDFYISDTAGCHPLLVNLVEQATGESSLLWDLADGTTSSQSNLSHYFSNTTSSTVTYNVSLVATSSYGCTDTAYQTVYVFPKPTADYTQTTLAGCQPLVVDFINNSSLAVQHNWDFGDGYTSVTPAATLSHTYTNTGIVSNLHNIILIVTSTDGCTDTLSSTVEVYPEIIADFSSDTVGCSPLLVNFNNLSQKSVLYNWNFGDGNSSAQQNPVHIFYNTTTSTQIYPVELIATSSYGCKDTAQTQITVFSKPTADFTVSTNNGCHPLTVSVTDNSILTDSVIWDLGDGTIFHTSGDFTHIYTNTGSTSVINNIRLEIITNEGCSDTLTIPVEVYPVVIAQFSPDTAACSPVMISFDNQSVNGNQYDWNFGDGTSSTQQYPSHSFVNNTVNDITFDVVLTVTSIYGCTDVDSSQVTVYPSPQVNFTALPSSQQYPDATVSFNNQTNNGFWQYQWSFGDSITDFLANPSPHTYATWGEYTIWLKVWSNNCIDSAYQIVEILPPVPIADFSGGGSGCRPLEINFINQSQWGASYMWYFGDGVTSNEENPTHLYYQEGTYTVKLVVTGFGGDQNTKVLQNAVEVYPNATAYFNYYPEEVSVPSEEVQFVNLSLNANTYLWDFGDGTVSTEIQPVHAYQKAGNYPVTLIADNEYGCADTMTVENAVLAKETGTIDFPNAFKPKTDGPSDGKYDPKSYDNTIFFPIYESVEEYHLMIFNRWGELIFETFDIHQGWDGYYRGKLCQQDAYVWKVEGRYTTGERFEKIGDVTLIR